MGKTQILIVSYLMLDRNISIVNSANVCSLSSLLMVRRSASNHKAPVDLLQQDHTHELMRKGHLGKTKPDIA